MVEIVKTLAVYNQLGEGPLWHAGEDCLYWVDIEAYRVYHYRRADGSIEFFDVGLPVTALGLRASGGFVAATRDGFAFWWPQRAGLEFIGDPEADRPEARFNDGIVDPQGRFWAGTMSPGATSSLYRLDPDLSVKVMERGITTSNGIGWSLDRRTMYYTDTRKRVIYAYEYNAATGEIANRRDFITVPDEAGEGSPDGLAVDAEGFIWSARWGGWRLCRYDPAGKLVLTVRMPAARITSCAFGGPDMDELYVTSSAVGLSAEELKAQPDAGNVFVLRPGVQGTLPGVFAG